MPRTRELKPSFFNNEDLCECEPLARLLFQGLWCHADCRGVVENRPGRLKMLILPADNCNVPELLAQLEARHLIHSYEANGHKLLHIPTFTKHQNIHPKEAPSEFPLPAETCRGLPGLAGTSLTIPSIPSLPSLLPTASQPKGGSQTEPNEGRHTAGLFATIAEVTASDPDVSGSHIGRACKDLLKADPPYTAAEVQKLASLLGKRGFTLPLTIGTVTKYIGWTRDTKQKLRGKTLDDVEREMRERRKRAEADKIKAANGRESA